MRLLVKLFLLNVLAACGAPGSDAVFVAQKPKSTVVDSSKPKPLPNPDAPSVATRRYLGTYRRQGDTAQFQPCGTKTIYEVTATPITFAILREKYRWAAPWLGASLFTVFQGALVTDTPSVAGGRGDSTKATPRTRFLVAFVDSMRAGRPNDCDGVRFH